MRVQLDSGQVIDLGETEATPTISLTDFSLRETDDFGVTTVVPREFARRMAVKLIVPFDQVDTLQRTLASLRAKPALWVADERYASLAFRGFYKDFQIDLAGVPVSYCTLTVEGLVASEAFNDDGSDPAPLDYNSTLQLLQPAIIEGPALIASSVNEADYPEWDGGLPYPKGARVIKAATHRTYESAIDGNAGNDPAGVSGKWFDIGPTNRWAMFDQALGTATTGAGAIAVEVQSGVVGGIALLDIVATSVRVQIGGYYDQIKQPTPSGTVTFLDIPNATDSAVITISGPGTVSVGTLLIGRLVDLGLTETSPTAGITDFSLKETDQFGAVTVVERAWAKRMSLRSVIRTDAIDIVAGRIAAVRAQPSLWIGSDGIDSLTIYGFFKDFAIEVDANISKLSLAIEGLSTAGKDEPLGAMVNWPDIADPEGTKPQDNADVTSENTSKDTAAVGERPAAEVLSGIDTAHQAIDAVEELTTGIIANVDGLIETYGDTASAAASASAAAQHETNAQTAEQNAETARAGAEGAYQSAFTHAGNAETFRNQASSYRDEAQGYSATASEQAGLSVTARQDAQNAASASNSSAGVATAKADEAGQSAQASQSAEVRASTFALDAGGRATSNIVGRGSFDERGRGNWQGQVQVLRDDGAGGFYVLQQTNRDAFEGEFIPGDWSGRRFRVSGHAAAFGAYGARAGLRLLMADGSYQYYTVAAGGPYQGYADFSGEFVLPPNVSAAHPFLQSDGPWDAGNHGVNWRTARIEDITAQRVAQDYADAASSSYSNAEIARNQAGQSAQAASGHADTAAVRAGDAEAKASAASGSAAYAEDRASAAASSASLAAGYSGTAESAASVANDAKAVATERASAASASALLSAKFTGGGNLAPNTEFPSGDFSGWYSNRNASGAWDSIGVNLPDDSWHTAGTNALATHQAGRIGGGVEVACEWRSDVASATAGQYYQGFARVAAHRADVDLVLALMDSQGVWLDAATTSRTRANGGKNPSDWAQIGVPSRLAPPGTTQMMLLIRKYDTDDGQSDSWYWFEHAYLGAAREGQNSFNNYSPGNARVIDESSRAIIEDRAQAAAAANLAVAQRTSNLESAVGGPGGLSAQVSAASQTAADAIARTAGALYQQTVSVTGTRAQMSMYALLQDGTPTSGIDFVGDTFTFTGDVVIDGTLKPRKIDASLFAREGTMSWSGFVSPAPGQTVNVPASLTLNPIQPQGRFFYEVYIGLSTNAGQQTVGTYLGKPYYINYQGDGGLALRAYDDQGNTYYPVHGTSEGVRATSVFSATFAAAVTRGNYDSGIVNEGDYYSRTLSATYTLSSLNLHITWIAV